MVWVRVRARVRVRVRDRVRVRVRVGVLRYGNMLSTRPYIAFPHEHGYCGQAVTACTLTLNPDPKPSR